MEVPSEVGVVDQRHLHFQLVPWMVAGVQTQFVHLRRELTDAGIQLSVNEVRPWAPGGRIEKLPLPARTRGTLRSLYTLRRAFRHPADAVWSQVALPVLPYLLSTGWLRRAPIFFAIDCTPRLLFELGRHYRAMASDPGSFKGRVTTAGYRTFFKRCAGLLPWSHWAARSMIEDYGANPERIHVLPPGIDTNRWKPAERPATIQGGGLRLLFVGADFERKGGPLLLDVYRRHLRAMCTLDMVTKASLGPEPGVTVHTGFGPDDAGLQQLFNCADVLVVPTLADCFSMAAIEAMACGVPVITSSVGGIPEIVLDGETGLLVPPGDGRRLLTAMRELISDVEARRRLGQAAREVAVRRFNASVQARLTVETMLSSISSKARSPSTSSVTPRI